MKFLVDAELPRKFVSWLTAAGHDAIHTLDLPRKNLTTDKEVTSIAVADARIVISKDDDFVQAYLLNGEPALLLVSTGNISNINLERLIRENLALLESAFETHRYVEITSDAIVIHE